MPNFHIEGRQKAMKDLQMNFLFEVSIPEISKFAPSFKDEDEFIIRAKTASIPGKTIQTVESYFMGMKSVYPSRVDYSNSLTVDFEETEDQKVIKAINEWQNTIFNTVDSDANTGHSLAESKRNGRTTNIYLKMYKYNGQIMENMIKFVNAFPSDISESGLDFAGSEAIRYSVTFSYDYWNLIKS